MPLKRALGGSQFFTLSFGGIVGLGWIVGMGEWLGKAGPGGAILAFLAGGLVMVLVGFCYGELGAMFPVSGGEVAYTYETFGVPTCFMTGWFLVLSYVTTVLFEAISVGWIASTLVPRIEGPLLYTIRGTPIHRGTLLLEIGVIALISLLNYLGVEPAARLQDLLTYSKIAFAIVFISLGIGWGQATNLQPLFRGGPPGNAWAGISSVFLTTPFWLIGFNSVAQMMEEKAPRTSLKVVGHMIFLSIVAATVFYCLVILSCSMIVPWMDLLHLNLPAATAFEVAFHSRLLPRTVLVAGLLGNVTVLNGTFLSASRVLFALGRAQIISPRLGVVHRSFGTPVAAVTLVATACFGGVFLGRGALLPVVNVTSTCTALAFVLVCLSVIKLRRSRTSQESAYRVPGGRATATLGALASVCIFFLSLYQPYVSGGKSFPLEWTLLIGWSLLGVLFWAGAGRIRLVRLTT